MSGLVAYGSDSESDVEIAAPAQKPTSQPQSATTALQEISKDASKTDKQVRTLAPVGVIVTTKRAASQERQVPIQQHKRQAAANSAIHAPQQTKSTDTNGSGLQVATVEQSSLIEDASVDEHGDDDDYDKTRLRRIESILLEQGHLANDYVEKLPPTPDPSAVDPMLQAKIAYFTNLRTQGVYLNDRLVRTHAFRNPSIMSKLIEFLELDEHGSNFDKSRYDPHGFPPESFYTELAVAQENKPLDPVPPFPTSIDAAIEMAKERAKRFVKSTDEPDRSSSQHQTGGERRRSKWDHK